MSGGFCGNITTKYRLLRKKNNNNKKKKPLSARHTRTIGLFTEKKVCKIINWLLESNHWPVPNPVRIHRNLGM
jgi:hypothetical protein